MSEESLAPSPRVLPVSVLAPFRRRAFRWLWVGVVAASVGSWAQTVGAQWLFVSSPDAATIVPLVQTATTLPMMLLALPAGVLADVFDRRWLMFAVQCYLIAVAALLAVLTAAGLMPRPAQAVPDDIREDGFLDVAQRRSSSGRPLIGTLVNDVHSQGFRRVQ